MKKRISFLSICLMVVLTLIMPCIADEPTTDLVTELATEVIEEATESPVEGETASGGATTPTEDETLATEGNIAPVDEWEAFKAKITDSATWTMIGMGLFTVLATIGVVKKKFGTIVECFKTIKRLLGVSGDEENGETVTGEIKKIKKELVGELKTAYKEEFANIRQEMEHYRNELKSKEDNEHRLYAIFTLFMTNCKISESAKAEILNILADVKKYEGDVSEFVAMAQEAIDKDKAEKESNAPATPTLDRMLAEDYMDLG